MNEFLPDSVESLGRQIGTSFFTVQVGRKLVNNHVSSFVCVTVRTHFTVALSRRGAGPERERAGGRGASASSGSRDQGAPGSPRRVSIQVQTRPASGASQERSGRVVQRARGRARGGSG